MGVYINNEIVPPMSSHKIQQFLKVAMCLPTAELYTTQAASDRTNTKQPVLYKSEKKENLLI